MFLLHQELSKREKVSVLWMALWILSAALVLITMNIVMVRLQINSDITDFIIIGLCAVATYILIKKNLVSFKYCIIDDEFIVHEVLGSKEKMILNLNLNQIVTFEKTQGTSFEKDKQGDYSSKQRLYNSTKKLNRHYIVFEESNELRWFTFQPSDYMVELMRGKINIQDVPLQG